MNGSNGLIVRVILFGVVSSTLSVLTALSLENVHKEKRRETCTTLEAVLESSTKFTLETRDFIAR